MGLRIKRYKELPQSAIPQGVFKNQILDNVTKHFASKEMQTMMILSSISAISSVLPNVSGCHDRKTIYPNMYLFVIAPASSGKGNMGLVRFLIQKIDEELRNTMIKREKIFATKKNERNKYRMLLIPANNSAAGFNELLYQNNGEGLFLETEGDTLSFTLGKDYGNYSDGLRKNFHHEAISVYRKTEGKNIYVECPKLSVILSGTPQQLPRLINNKEDGLLSRFAFFHLGNSDKWNNAFFNQGVTLENEFKKIGDVVFQLKKKVEKFDSIRFEFTELQQKTLNSIFGSKQNQYIGFNRDSMIAFTRRTALIVLKTAMVLSIMKAHEENRLQARIICSEEVFLYAISFIDMLLENAQKALGLYKIQQSVDKKMVLLNKLPDSFKTSEAIKTGWILDIQKRTVEGYLTQWTEESILERLKHGMFIKKKT